MSINDVVKTVSKRTGWNLQWKLEGGTLTWWDDKNRQRSTGSLRMIPGFETALGLHEVYGRPLEWLSLEERAAIAKELSPHSTENLTLEMENPFNLC